MNLYFYRSRSGIRNFGDELNPWLWPRLLGSAIDTDEKVLLVGIGTILDSRIPERPAKVVFGSGAGYGHPLKIDDRYSIYCVRGPITAASLGLDRRLAITDSAQLVTLEFSPGGKRDSAWSYMPHWNMHGGTLADICEKAGIRYIDPTEPNVEKTLNQITESEVLITEAMHGAIIADAYDVPWIPVRTTPDILDVKWNDWCRSVGLDYRPVPLMPVWDKPDLTPGYLALKQRTKTLIIAYQLRRLLQRGRPALSSRSRSQSNLERLGEQLESLREDYRRGTFRGYRV